MDTTRRARPPMRGGADIVRDFDRIAHAIDASQGGDSLSPCEEWLLGQIPRCDTILEVGCGAGTLTRRLAGRARSIVAIDVSPVMIELARRRGWRVRNVEYRLADIRDMSIPSSTFDVVIGVAVLHHVPLEDTVRRLAGAVRPGGWFFIQDLVERRALRHLPMNAGAWLARRWRWMRGGRNGRTDAVVSALYREHGRGERYLRPEDVASAYATVLPGARIVHHLEWRYSVLWQRPGLPLSPHRSAGRAAGR